MNVALLAESEVDQQILEYLVSTILAQRVDVALPRKFEVMGRPGVRNTLPSFVKHTHYCTNADRIVATADADGPLDHNQDERCACRLCEPRGAALRGLGELQETQRQDLPTLAIGIAVPAIEAWLLVNKRPDMREANFATVSESMYHAKRKLKKKRSTVPRFRPP